MFLCHTVWRKIGPQLVEYMKFRKDARLESERRKLIGPRTTIAIDVLHQYKLSCLPFACVMPEPPDFLAFPEVKAILDMPSGDEVTRQTFESVIASLPGIIHDWRTEMNQQLVRHFERAKQNEIDLQCSISGRRLLYFEGNKLKKEKANPVNIQITRLRSKTLTSRPRCSHALTAFSRPSWSFSANLDTLGLM
jgi:hypothetical protein